MLSSMVSAVLPRGLVSSKSKEELIAGLQQAYRQYGSLDTDGAKRAFLSITTSLPLYGVAVFAVKVPRATQCLVLGREAKLLVS